MHRLPFFLFGYLCLMAGYFLGALSTAPHWHNGVIVSVSYWGGYLFIYHVLKWEIRT